MKKYNWKGYDFIGTVPEFAEKFGYCKTPTFVNAVKNMSRQRYNRMDANEQKTYDEKRRRAKRAYCIYMDKDMTESYIITKEEYLATRLPVKKKAHETFMLTYRDRILPHSFIGNNYDEIPVRSAMERMLLKPSNLPSSFCWRQGISTATIRRNARLYLSIIPRFILHTPMA